MLWLTIGCGGGVEPPPDGEPVLRAGVFLVQDVRGKPFGVIFGAERFFEGWLIEAGATADCADPGAAPVDTLLGRTATYLAIDTAGAVTFDLSWARGACYLSDGSAASVTFGRSIFRGRATALQGDTITIEPGGGPGDARLRWLAPHPTIGVTLGLENGAGTEVLALLFY